MQQLAAAPDAQLTIDGNTRLVAADLDRGTSSMIVRRLVFATLVSLCALASGLVFSAAAFAAPEPPLTRSPATAITATTAVLEGTLNPGASVKAGWYFAYSTEFSCLIEPEISPVEAEVEGEAVPEHVEVTKLQPNRTYAFCMIATDEEGEATPSSNEVSFTTLAATPTIDSETSSAVSSTAATLEAQVNPNNQASVAYLQYSSSAKVNGSGSLEGVTQLPAPPGRSIGSGYGDQPVGPSTVTRLSPGSTYYYQAVATNRTGVSYGPVRSFTTVPTPTTDPVSAIEASTAIFHGHLTLDGVDTEYSFEYRAGAECSGGSSTPTGNAGTGAGTALLSASASELLPGTLYTVCLVSSNAFGSEQGPAVTFTTFAVAPSIESESAVDVTAESASLQAQIDPRGAQTTYHFEYGTSEAYGQSTGESASIGAGVAGLPAIAHLQGLQAGTAYHYRAVATNASGTVDGADRTFTTQSSRSEAVLPDGRRWELVTPANIQGTLIYPLGYINGDQIRAAANGDAITFDAAAPFVNNAAGNRALEESQGLSVRHEGPAGPTWETADIATPHDGELGHVHTVQTEEYLLFDSDLSQAIVEPNGDTPLPPLAPGSEKTVYLRNNPTGEYQALVTSANVPPGTHFGGNEETEAAFHYVAATPDLSHVVLQASEVALTSNAASAGLQHGLYVWSEGQLQLVSVLPDGEPSGGVLGRETIVRNAISEDGTRVFWAEGANASPIFMRDTVRDETVQVAEDARFETANVDGSRAFFTTGEGPASPDAGDLGVFEVTSGQGEPLAGRTTMLTETGELDGVIGASEDGTSIYFVDTAVLGDGAMHGAENGGANLYVEHYDEATKAWAPPLLIAALSPEDHNDWGVGPESEIYRLIGMTARVSPNGRYLAFMSDKSLTGYDNHDASSGVPDEEVFLYDASTGRLACASCNPTGGRPQGLQVPEEGVGPLIDYTKDAWTNRWLAANVPTWEALHQFEGIHPPVVQPRYLSNSGRLFFNSVDALVPADVNGRADVYEYEPEGIPESDRACSSASAGGSEVYKPARAVEVEGRTIEEGAGCVALISAGTSSEESAFMEASENGEDVFLLTSSHLSPLADSTSVEIYDAHECSSSSPCAPEAAAAPPPCTTGEACKPAPTPQPTIFGAPSSETFSGAGDLVPPPSVAVKATTKPKLPKCRRGTRRSSKGKCVRSKKPKAKRSARGRQ
jgi:hypothetical protein